MSSLGLRLGVLNDGIAATGLSELGTFVAGHVFRGSGEKVALAPAGPFKLPYAVPAGGAVSALRLHQGLAQLLGNTTAQPVQNIGLLFADSYAPQPGLFGLMFDLGFKTPDDQSGGMFTQVPRQGCAVFLGAIHRARQGAAFNQQVAFTSVHEVGHIFNLLHQDSPLTFMARSLADAPYGPEAFFFGTNQSKWLARCGIDPDVTPGGNPFRDMGCADRAVEPTSAGKLRLDVELSSRQFWPFEPVMLNISLGLRERARSVLVPDEVDPGYSRFRIVIEEPGGERRLYRAPLRFCARSPMLRLTPNAPFRRDLPIFGQAGGFTFAKPGLHRLWVDFDLTSRTTVRSNICDFEVLSMRSRTKAFKDLMATLGTPEAVRALFYREGPTQTLRELVATMNEVQDPAVRAMTRYLCARAATPSHRQETARDARWARRQLDAALDSGLLPAHQQLRAQQAADRLSTRVTALGRPK